MNEMKCFYNIYIVDNICKHFSIIRTKTLYSLRGCKEYMTSTPVEKTGN